MKNFTACRRSLRKKALREGVASDTLFTSVASEWREGVSRWVCGKDVVRGEREERRLLGAMIEANMLLTGLLCNEEAVTVQSFDQLKLLRRLTRIDEKQVFRDMVANGVNSVEDVENMLRRDVANRLRFLSPEKRVALRKKLSKKMENEDRWEKEILRHLLSQVNVTSAVIRNILRLHPNVGSLRRVTRLSLRNTFGIDDARLQDAIFGVVKCFSEDISIDGRSLFPHVTSLPSPFQCRGSIVLTDFARLVTIDLKSTCNSITLHGCGALERFRVDNVQGDLTVTNCERLGRLPEDLRVTGDVNLEGCTLLTSLDGLKFCGGDLKLRGTKIQQLPETLRFRGTVDCTDCTLLQKLPDSLAIPGSFILDGCASLTALPRVKLDVGGSMSLAGCSILNFPSDQFNVARTLDLRQCSVLGRLPNGMSVGQIHFPRNTPIIFPDADITIMGDLHIGGCTKSIAFPRRLHVGGNLILHECHRLHVLCEHFEKLVVLGNLVLSDCSQLTTIRGTNVSVHGNVYLNDLPSLEILEDIRISGNLTIWQCQSLFSLPENLSVGGDLNCAELFLLTFLPEHVQIGQNVRFETCPALTGVPQSWTEWGPTVSGRPHEIVLRETGITPRFLRQINSSSAEFVRFILFESVFQQQPLQGQQQACDFASLEDAISFWIDLAASGKGECSSLSEVIPVACRRELILFLSKLKQSKEAQVDEMKFGLALRVVEILKLLAKDAETREELLHCISASVDRCSDKSVWALNMLTLQIEVHKGRGDRKLLEDLAKRAFALELLHLHVRNLLDDMPLETDDVCVYLRFEIALRESLNLPVSAQAMSYPSYVEITDGQIEEARAEVSKSLETGLESWKATWPEWQRQIRMEAGESLCFDNLPSMQLPKSKEVTNLVGEEVSDPITFDNGKTCVSLADFIAHWVPSGKDFYGSCLAAETFASNVRRVAFVDDESSLEVEEDSSKREYEEVPVQKPRKDHVPTTAQPPPVAKIESPINSNKDRKLKRKPKQTSTLKTS